MKYLKLALIAVAALMLPSLAHAFTAADQAACTIYGKAETERLDKADPEYFKDATVLYLNVPVEEYKRLYALKQTSRCTFLIDCRFKFSDRVCRTMQPY